MPEKAIPLKVATIPDNPTKLRKVPHQAAAIYHPGTAMRHYCR
jgi:hypothetical protein